MLLESVRKPDGNARPRLRKQRRCIAKTSSRSSASCSSFPSLSDVTAVEGQATGSPVGLHLYGPCARLLLDASCTTRRKASPAAATALGSLEPTAFRTVPRREGESARHEGVVSSCREGEGEGLDHPSPFSPRFRAHGESSHSLRSEQLDCAR